MSKRSSYSFIYNLQRVILLVFFTTTSIALSIPLVMLVERLFPNQLYPLLITLLIYISLVIILLIMALEASFYERFSSVFYVITLLLLIGLFPFGKTIAGATSVI